MVRTSRELPKELAEFGQRQFNETGAQSVEVLRVKAAVIRKYWAKLKGIAFLVGVVSLDRVRVYFFSATGVMLVGENVDHDIYGYKIYYGTHPKKFDGIITYKDGKAITNKLSSNNYLTINITNTLINENRRRDKKKLLEYPIIKNTVLYYFKVSAYDSYKVFTLYNHESKLSKMVWARPYAGSEID